MARPALRIDVTRKDQNQLKKLLSGGVLPVRVVLRVIALSQLAKGISAPRISEVVPLTPQAIRKARCWKTASDSVSSPWSAAIRPKASPAGQ